MCTTYVLDEVLGAIVQFVPVPSLRPVLTAHRHLARVAPAWRLDAFRSALSYYAVCPHTRNLRHLSHYLTVLTAPYLLHCRNKVTQVRDAVRSILMNVVVAHPLTLFRCRF